MIPKVEPESPVFTRPEAPVFTMNKNIPVGVASPVAKVEIKLPSDIILPDRQLDNALIILSF